VLQDWLRRLHDEVCIGAFVLAVEYELCVAAILALDDDPLSTGIGRLLIAWVAAPIECFHVGPSHAVSCDEAPGMEPISIERVTLGPKQELIRNDTRHEHSDQYGNAYRSGHEGRFEEHQEQGSSEGHVAETMGKKTVSCVDQSYLDGQLGHDFGHREFRKRGGKRRSLYEKPANSEPSDE